MGPVKVEVEDFFDGDMESEEDEEDGSEQDGTRSDEFDEMNVDENDEDVAICACEKEEETNGFDSRNPGIAVGTVHGKPQTLSLPERPAARSFR